MKPNWYAMKEWFPAAGAMCLVLVALSYALLRRGEVAEGIRRMSDLGATLTLTADAAIVGVRTPEEIDRLLARLRDLERRFEDSRRAGMVVPQLSEAARAAGLNVLSIEPLAAVRDGSSKANTAYPRYRVSVAGDYRHVADYLAGSARQRIPARVVEFLIERRVSGTGDPSNELTAEIQVEAFCPDAGPEEESA